jgi:hypothetical protein
VSNGGKFKLYTVLNGLLFPRLTEPRISFERAILFPAIISPQRDVNNSVVRSHLNSSLDTRNINLVSLIIPPDFFLLYMFKMTELNNHEDKYGDFDYFSMYGRLEAEMNLL